jgi:peptide/nickel transport system ATP-binding protein
MRDLQVEFGLTYLFIAHDLSVVRHISDAVAIMYLGRIVEFGSKAAVFANPRHPYTRGLLQSVPIPDPARRRKGPVPLAGGVPDPSNPPAGCAFHPRCRFVQDICRRERPELSETAAGHKAACHFVKELDMAATDMAKVV